MAYPLIRSSVLAQFPALVHDLGGPLDEILEEAGLHLEQITQPTLLIAFEKEIRLLQIAAHGCRCEHFGVELAQRQDVAIFGALSLLAMNCNTVLQGLQLFGRYIHYIAQAVELEIKEENDIGYFIIDTPYDVAADSDQFWDHTAALACTVMRMLCGQKWAPRATYIRRPEPPNAGRYNRYFRSPIAFDQGFNGLVFDNSVLHQPIHASINSMPHQLQEYLRKNFEGNFQEQLRRVINSLLATHDCSAKMVADSMGYTLRTFQRKLTKQDTSFQAQLDRVRRELAISYLEEPQFRLTDIAELLGFAELSVFSRSFKRWFGVTPLQWRSRQFA